MINKTAIMRLSSDIASYGFQRCDAARISEAAHSNDSPSSGQRPQPFHNVVCPFPGGLLGQSQV